MNSLTMQPVKGRKAGGGVVSVRWNVILFLLTVRMLLRDRLMNYPIVDAHATRLDLPVGFDNVEDDQDDTRTNSGFIGRRGARGNEM